MSISPRMTCQNSCCNIQSRKKMVGNKRIEQHQKWLLCEEALLPGLCLRDKICRYGKCDKLDNKVMIRGGTCFNSKLCFWQKCPKPHPHISYKFDFEADENTF